MRAELRDLHSADVPAGLEAFTPPDARAFSVAVEATIGPAGSDGGELFQFEVVGPDWFGVNPPGKGFRWGRHFLILDRWDYSVLHRVIADLCRHSEGRDWAEVAGKIARYGLWEFEDYREASS